MEMKENILKPKKRLDSKTQTVIGSPVDKKIISPIVKINSDDELLQSDKFFRILLSKSKDRLIQKANISQDHIFKSLTVIYNRGIVQLSLMSLKEAHNLRFLVYKQFVKTENRKKNQKKLKNFLGSCLKFVEFKRISVFFRLIGLCQDKTNPSSSN